MKSKTVPTTVPYLTATSLKVNCYEKLITAPANSKKTYGKKNEYLGRGDLSWAEVSGSGVALPDLGDLPHYQALHFPGRQSVGLHLFLLAM
jgi:hypothetical protein